MRIKANKTKNQFTIKYITRQQRYYKYFATGLGAFLLAYVCASILAPVGTSSAAEVQQTVNYNNSINGYSLSFTSTGTLDVSMDAVPAGNYKAVSDTLTTKTNVPSGYKLSISVEDNNIYNADDIDKVSTHLSPVGSTYPAETTLNNNQWGFKVASVDEVPAADTTWSAVPTTATKIKEYTSPTPDAGDTTTVSYGFRANTSLPAGTYSTVITYTVYAEDAEEFPYMQDFTTAECNAMEDNQITTLTDKRDGKAYRITKMKDGNCWMSQNLALDGGRTLTPEDSNVTANRILVQNVDFETSINNTDVQIYSGAAEQSDEYGSKFGNYYNFLAATAGVGTIEVTQTGNIYESVCPKGWRLPDGGAGNHSYANLFESYGLPNTNINASTDSDSVALYLERVQKAPFYIPEAGNHTGGGDHTDGIIYQWTRFSRNSTIAGRLQLGTEGYYPRGIDSNKKDSFPIRCVFEGDVIYNNQYMQDVTTTMCKNTAEGAAYSLIDARGQYSAGSTSGTYGVLKAKDGNCWMTSNFNLYNKTISSTDSDIPDGTTYTIPNTSNWSGNVYTEPKVHRATNTNYTDQVYYNWTSAVALSDGSTTEQQDNSICPLRWQLPINGDKDTDKSYAKLMNAYSITTSPELIANTALGFTYFGYWSKGGSSGFEYGQGSEGDFWSSTPTSDTNARFLHHNSSGSLAPQGDYNKGYGFSLRCLVR